MTPQLIAELAAAIAQATRRPFRPAGSITVGGGDINRSYRLTGADGTDYFVKLNDARHGAMFTAEAAGLDALAATHTLRVPRVVAHGRAGTYCYLVLEHMDLGNRGDARRLGESLAALHRCTAGRFGFEQDDFIGTTLQPNGWKDDWIEFWRERRLGHQLKLAAGHGYGGELQRLGERLLDWLPAYFAAYTPQPSLLHGDLWGGNHGFLTDGTPVIFDPATYYGDRECDLAMTELFGGYSADFYAAYRAAWPLDAGYAVRRELYNLYHILNHANLFGAGYPQQATRIMQKLLAAAA